MRIATWFAVVSLAVLPLVSSYAQAASPGGANLSAAALEVVKLAGAGTSEEVVLAYVQTMQTPFNLSADDLLYLKNVGVSAPVITAMLNRDAALRAQAPASEAAPVVAEPTKAVAAEALAATASQPVYVSNAPADVTYFYNDLAPYGTWIDLPGFGWCWQPTAAVLDRNWQPYCQNGHWVNTEAGWYWASDYSWGWAPFHYGRWYRHSSAGWVWFPDKVWGPAWVVWRSGGDYCGWAPLPPHAEFDVRRGWRYNGRSVTATFDFGLQPDCFTFIGLKNFSDHDLGRWRLPPPQVGPIFRSTAIINNYGYDNNIFINHGIPLSRVEFAIGGRLPPVHFQDPPRGWRPGQPLGPGPGGGGPILYRPQPLPPPSPRGPITAMRFDPRHPPGVMNGPGGGKAGPGGGMVGPGGGKSGPSGGMVGPGGGKSGPSGGMSGRGGGKSGPSGGMSGPGGGKSGPSGGMSGPGGGKSGPSSGLSGPGGSKSGPSGGMSGPGGGKSGPSSGMFGPGGSKSGPSGGMSGPGGGKSGPSSGMSGPGGSKSGPSGGMSGPGGGKSGPSSGMSGPGGSKSGPGGGTPYSAGGMSGPGGSRSGPSGGMSGPGGSKSGPSGGKSGPSGSTVNTGAGKPGSSGSMPPSGGSKSSPGGGKSGPGGPNYP
jgi:hypothetical protein